MLQLLLLGNGELIGVFEKFNKLVFREFPFCIWTGHCTVVCFVIELGWLLMVLLDDWLSISVNHVDLLLWLVSLMLLL